MPARRDRRPTPTRPGSALRVRDRKGDVLTYPSPFGRRKAAANCSPSMTHAGDGGLLPPTTTWSPQAHSTGCWPIRRMRMEDRSYVAAHRCSSSADTARVDRPVWAPNCPRIERWVSLASSTQRSMSGWRYGRHAKPVLDNASLPSSRGAQRSRSSNGAVFRQRIGRSLALSRPWSHSTRLLGNVDLCGARPPAPVRRSPRAAGRRDRSRPGGDGRGRGSLM